MSNMDKMIIELGVITLVMACILLVVVFQNHINVGCHVVGTEINGDYSTEYLLVGDC